MNNYKKICIGLIISFVYQTMLVSCDDFLEIEPKGFINPINFFKNESDAESAVISGYKTFGSGVPGSFGWWQDFQLPAMSDDFFVRPLATPNEVNLNAKFIEFTASSGPHGIYYRVDKINTLSFAIDGISGMMNFSRKKELIAESKFLRAYEYFIMVRLFGGVPINDSNISTADEASNIPRGTKEQVYDLIISDLTAAIEGLPVTAVAHGRPTRYTAMALLSKVYLTRGEWSEAVSWAERVINESDRILLPVYADIFDDANENNAESLFEVQFLIEQGRANQVGSWPRGIGTNGDQDFFIGPNWGGVYVASDDLLADFEPNDIRRNMIATEVINSAGDVLGFNADGVTPNYSIKRTPRAYIDRIESNNNSSYNFIALRLGEIYLIAAEAGNEVNGPSGALTYINAVRNRAGLDNLEVTNPAVATDASEFRKALRKERRTELFDERIRYFDLLRWGTLIESVLKATPDATIQPHHVLFPIPDNVFDRNKGLDRERDQNPGY